LSFWATIGFIGTIPEDFAVVAWFFWMKPGDIEVVGCWLCDRIAVGLKA
jgi:hypothetical protein